MVAALVAWAHAARAWCASEVTRSADLGAGCDEDYPPHLQEPLLGCDWDGHFVLTGAARKAFYAQTLQPDVDHLAENLGLCDPGELAIHVDVALGVTTTQWSPTWVDVTLSVWSNSPRADCHDQFQAGTDAGATLAKLVSAAPVLIDRCLELHPG